LESTRKNWHLKVGKPVRRFPFTAWPVFEDEDKFADYHRVKHAMMMSLGSSVTSFIYE